MLEGTSNQGLPVEIILQKELSSMCSEKVNSILSGQSPTELKEFTWSKLVNELLESSPVFLSLLQSCTRTRRRRPNQVAVIGMCAAILLKHRHSKISLVQRILSLILCAGHSGKQVHINYYDVT